MPTLPEINPVYIKHEATERKTWGKNNNASKKSLIINYGVLSLILPGKGILVPVQRVINSVVQSKWKKDTKHVTIKYQTPNLLASE